MCECTAQQKEDHAIASTSKPIHPNDRHLVTFMVGASLEVARRYAVANGNYNLCECFQDGEPQGCPESRDPKRIKVATRKGVVTAVLCVGEGGAYVR